MWLSQCRWNLYLVGSRVSTTRTATGSGMNWLAPAGAALAMPSGSTAEIAAAPATTPAPWMKRRRPIGPMAASGRVKWSSVSRMRGKNLGRWSRQRYRRTSAVPGYFVGRQGRRGRDVEGTETSFHRDADDQITALTDQARQTRTFGAEHHA